MCACVRVCVCVCLCVCVFVCVSGCMSVYGITLPLISVSCDGIRLE